MKQKLIQKESLDNFERETVLLGIKETFLN